MKSAKRPCKSAAICDGGVAAGKTKVKHDSTDGLLAVCLKLSRSFLPTTQRQHRPAGAAFQLVIGCSNSQYHHLTVPGDSGEDLWRKRFADVLIATVGFHSFTDKRVLIQPLHKLRGIRHRHGTLRIGERNITIISSQNTCPSRILQLGGNALHTPLEVNSFLFRLLIGTIGIRATLMLRAKGYQPPPEARCK